MTDRELPTERHTEQAEPITKLLGGEQLTAAGRPEDAQRAFTSALDSLRQYRHQLNGHEHGPIESNLALVEASLYYSRAETTRLIVCAQASAAPNVTNESYYTLLRASRLDLDAAALAAPRATYDRSPDEAELINHALTYLLARSDGVLHMVIGLTAPHYMTNDVSFVIARDRLQTADFMLSDGFWPDGLAPPGETPATRATRINTNRSLDPQLPELISMSEAAVRGARTMPPPLLITPRRIRLRPQRLVPMLSHTAFCQPGPRASEIFDFGS